MSISARDAEFLAAHLAPSLRMAASIAATKTFQMFVNHGVRPFRIDSVDFVCDENIASDGSNYYVVTLQKGATVIATMTMLSTALTAGTKRSFTLSATDADAVLAAAGVLKVVYTLTGTLGMNPNVIQVHGRLV